MKYQKVTPCSSGNFKFFIKDLYEMLYMFKMGHYMVHTPLGENY